ncbi:NUDIX hydrolase [Streptomyces rimosus]|uniref:NUDIX domain-containing protein n=1 Tax=Streptomyces rimosus TaxID=1927 RepID=UPI00099E0DC0|nr:NUDIX hydrolase [Streptomyces rimosus]
MRPTPDDPDAWHAYLAEGNAKQPRKRVAADVLLRNTHGTYLLVQPTYKPGWDLPGGMAEANEAPEDAAVREVKEELGVTITLLGLLVVDRVPPHGPRCDQLAFIFDVSAGQKACLGASRCASVYCCECFPKEGDTSTSEEAGEPGHVTLRARWQGGEPPE